MENLIVFRPHGFDPNWINRLLTTSVSNNVCQSLRLCITMQGWKHRFHNFYASMFGKYFGFDSCI